MIKRYILASLLLCSVVVSFGMSNKIRKSIIDHTIDGQKAMVIIVPTYNNSKNDICIKNLSSLLDQEYENFFVIVINDCSTDDTFQKLEQYVATHPRKDKVLLVNNSARVGALANYYNAWQSLEEHLIILQLDGDDWLAHSKVLKRLNDYYNNWYIWMTFGQFRQYPSGEIGFCKAISHDVIRKHNYRKSEWLSTHLRTGYAWLFKKIHQADLFYNGQFMSACGDRAVMYPLLEMSAGHFVAIDEVLYIYNCSNPLADVRINLPEQQKMCRYICSQPAYKSIEEAAVDCIIFSYNRPLQLYALLESMEKYITGCNNIYVMYRSDNDQFDQGYDIVQEKFNYVHYEKQSKEPAQDFKPLLVKLSKLSTAPYVLFGVDDIVVKDYCDLQEAVTSMELYKAYGCYLRLSPLIDYLYSWQRPQLVPALTAVKNGFLWQFSTASPISDWGYPHTVDMTIYRKKDIINEIINMTYHNPNTFECQWSQHVEKIKRMHGFCYEQSKIVNLPLNLVQNSFNNPHMTEEMFEPEQLLLKFLDGYKMDIRTLFRIKNRSVHIEYRPRFIRR